MHHLGVRQIEEIDRPVRLIAVLFSVKSRLLEVDGDRENPDILFRLYHGETPDLNIVLFVSAVRVGEVSTFYGLCLIILIFTQLKFESIKGFFPDFTGGEGHKLMKKPEFVLHSSSKGGGERIDLIRQYVGLSGDSIFTYDVGSRFHRKKKPSAAESGFSGK